jgi:hypothetical protein
MRIIIILFILAQASLAMDVKILGRNFSFTKIDKVYVYGNCEKDCKAKKLFQTYLKKPFKPKSKEKFFTQTSSVLCRDYWKAVSVIGVHENGNKGAFCLFKDQSMLDLDSLQEVIDE